MGVMRFCLVVAVMGIGRVGYGEGMMKVVGSSVVDPAGLTMDGTYGPLINGLSFQQYPIASLNGYQYVVYYDGERRVCVGRRKVPALKWEVIRFSDYAFKGDDAHNVAVLGICPADGTIHLAFDHHVSKLHYRVSEKGAATHPEGVKWTAELFGGITDQLEKKMDHVTYPQFVETPEGNLQLFYRYGTSGAGDRYVVDYDGGTGKWHGTREIDSGKGTFSDMFGKSTARNGYENGYVYGADGKLHTTWCWRETTQGANHDICYAWSPDEGVTWRNSAGAVVNSGDGKEMISVDSPGITVVPLDRTFSLMNTQAEGVDSKGRVHVVMWHRKEEEGYRKESWDPVHSAYYHYWRGEDGVWKESRIPGEVGNRPKMVFDGKDDAYVLTVVNRNQKEWQSGIYFVDGELVVWKATAGSGWKDWAVAYRDAGHYMSEPLMDVGRMKEGVLSVILQESAEKKRAPAAIRVLELGVE